MKAPTLLPAVLALLLAACGEAGVAAPAAEQDNKAQTANASAPAATNASFPALTGRVVDSGDLLNLSEEERLTADLAALEQRTSDQLVIVTVASLEGRSIEDYGLALGNHWRVGQAEKDNGVLLIVAPTEGRVRIQIGYGLEPILTNARAQEIIDRDMLPPLRRGAWHEAIGAGTREIIETLVANAAQPRRGRS